jgi:ribosomal protein S2
MLKLSYVLIKYVINMGFPFWFVDFNLTKEDIIKNSASNTGEFYVTRRWIRGLISNFYVITKEYRYYLMKKAFIDSNKVRDIFDK